MTDTARDSIRKRRQVAESMQGQPYSGETHQNEEVVEQEQGKYYIETYGCQMNFSDSEIVASILNKAGYSATTEKEEADLLLVNTCAIRENAEQRVRARLQELKKMKEDKPEAIIGVLGCMAERLRHKLLEQEKLVDLVVGPDAYRSLPKLINEVHGGQKGVNVLLSREETYADISPVRYATNNLSAFISIMRGCDNMCSFCVVPFTRGRERSRDPYTIVEEAQELVNNGYKEVTLLGQNVDSYNWQDENGNEKVNFAELLERVAEVDDQLRVRFSTSHPKDMTDKVLRAMSRHKNICNYIHLPVQSGNNRILDLMRRGYSREWYLERIQAIRDILPDCAISTDIITGFCSETEEEHQDTLSLMEEVKYDLAYMFYYSERPKTLAARKYEDDVPLKVKKRRLSEVIELQQKHAEELNQAELDKKHRVLVEGTSKRSEHDFKGRNDKNKVVIFPKQEGVEPGNYVDVFVNRCTSATLFGEITNPDVKL
jgi:tRNA-2-methylthio-N6-dimethylallyladenosine synthase